MHLLHDSLLVVIAQRATEFVIVHGWTVLLHAPQPGNLRRGSKGRQIGREDSRKGNAVVTLLAYLSFGEVHSKVSDYLHAFEGLENIALLK